MKNLSLAEFKLWLSKQVPHKEEEKRKTDIIVGEMVVPRLGIERLKQKMQESNLAKEFKKKGGKVILINENLVTIEVNNKQFVLPRIYVKLA